ncbi:MAG: hypothetical protein DA408_16695 [Bacteroidetes bacterium]|nr:MAG: hypothetical protein C7N36_07075 [Bacteroidota bacterium]PTM10138.1 MAG: hypothetical protein DA408_16695 [Bacteroidota bacterium]
MKIKSELQNYLSKDLHVKDITIDIESADEMTVGGGIFSVLGGIISIAGQWAWLSFVIAGLIALISAYSSASQPVVGQIPILSYDYEDIENPVKTLPWTTFCHEKVTKEIGAITYCELGDTPPGTFYTYHSATQAK